MAVTAVTPSQSRPRGGALLRMWPRALLVLLVAAIVAVGALTAAITGAASAYRSSEAGLEQGVQSARADGYTDQDLAPVLTGLAALRGAPAPRIGDRLSFYQHARATADDLRAQLQGLRTSALSNYRQQLDSGLAAARASLAEAQAAGVDDAALAPIGKTLDGATTQAPAARNATELRRLIALVTPAAGQVAQLAQAQVTENARVAAAITSLKAAHPGDIEAVRQAGQASLAAGRNDGALAGFLKLHALDTAVARLEAAAAPLGGGDFDQVARAAALAQVRGADLHGALAAAMPEKVIAVSLSAQHLWAYDHGKVTMDTAVTTGRPALPTDIGPMSVLRKSSPWKMHSPWGRGSPYWYPDTVVRKVLWFTNTGEGLHDAVWEPLSYYGPGGQNTSVASHGCIHLPGSTVDFLYDWTPVGTPVIVIPGDGSPTAAQLAADTIDLPSAQYVSHGS